MDVNVICIIFQEMHLHKRHSKRRK